VNAASVLGLSPSAVSKAITRLEDDLQIQLIFRTTRSITLTTAGNDYANHARTLLRDLDDCENRLQEENQLAHGTLRINLPVSYGRQYILPLLTDFCAEYPNINLNVSFEDSYVDMIEHSIDVTIRSGTLEDSSLVARQLSPMDFLICASPDYLENKRAILPNEYDKHAWIRFRFRQSGRLNPIMVKKGNRILYTDPGRDFIVDDGEASASLCAAGMGLAQLPHFTLRSWLDDGKLCVIAPYLRAPKFGVWMIYAKRDYLPVKIRLFTDFIETRISAGGETPRHTWAEQYS